MAGVLDASGLGEALPDLSSLTKDTSLLRSLCRRSNEKLISQLREAEQGERLLQIAREDAKLGRLTEPRPIQACFA